VVPNDVVYNTRHLRDRDTNVPREAALNQILGSLDEAKAAMNTKTRRIEFEASERNEHLLKSRMRSLLKSKWAVR
jgi:hypothetical protein